MDRTTAVAVATVIGGGLALQAPLNALLGRSVGGLQAAAVSFVVGLTALLALASVLGGFGGLARLGEVPWWALVGGGLIGAAYVTSIVWTTRALGVGGLTAVTIAGQFAVAITVDHFGWLGLERTPVTPAKLGGLALLAAGAYLVVRD